jgi:hypothetical protein
MHNSNSERLWRVAWVHRNGYLAPYQYVVAKKYREAHRMVLETKPRLLDFPESWSFRLEELDLVQVNGKWV